MLSELPNELLVIITNFLPLWDIISLSTTCSRLHDATQLHHWTFPQKLIYQRQYNQRASNTRWYGTGYSSDGLFGAEITDELIRRISDLTIANGYSLASLPINKLNDWYIIMTSNLYIERFYPLIYPLIDADHIGDGSTSYSLARGFVHGGGSPRHVTVPSFKYYDESRILPAREEDLLTKLNRHCYLVHSGLPNYQIFGSEVDIGPCYCGPDQVRCPHCDQIFTTAIGREDIAETRLIISDDHLRQYLTPRVEFSHFRPVMDEFPSCFSRRVAPMKILQWGKTDDDEYYFLAGDSIEDGGTLYFVDSEDTMSVISNWPIVKFALGSRGGLFFLTLDGEVYNYDTQDTVLYRLLNNGGVIEQNLIYYLPLGRSSLFPGEPTLLKSEILKSEILKSEILKSEILKSEILKSEILKSEILKSEILESATLEERRKVAIIHAQPIVDFVLRERNSTEEFDYCLDVVYLTIDGRYGSYTQDLDLNFVMEYEDDEPYCMFYPKFAGRIYELRCNSGEVHNQLAIRAN